MNCLWINKDNLSIYLWTGVWYQTNVNDCVGSLHLHLYMAENVLVCFHFATQCTICISMTCT